MESNNLVNVCEIIKVKRKYVRVIDRPKKPVFTIRHTTADNPIILYFN